ncbi:MAG TPA: ATP synthase F1 subunit gamma, partial [bacterium]|nr:ATP synthase F1 subunit gamma [bacterium]
MAKAKIILKRRKSVRNTKKITRTMEMVSTAKYKQAHARITASTPYQEKLREMMADLSSLGTEISHPLLETRPCKRSLVLVITSNRGLAGGYNANLLFKAREVIARDRREGAQVDLEIVGKKGIIFFRHQGEALTAQYDHFGGRFGFAEVNAIADQYIRRYSEGEIDRVTVVYQRYFSAGRQAPVAEILLPLQALDSASAEAPGAAKNERRREVNYLYSPDPVSLLKELLPAYFRTSLYGSFLQAVVGEHLARMVAMKNATDAADKLIKRLTRMYNRARQSQITNEI